MVIQWIALTLTSEWDTCRWGPISTRDPASGLIDRNGYFHRTAEALAELADPATVAREIAAQVAAATAAGVAVSHLDSHMLSLLCPQLWSTYLALALELRLPVLLPRFDEAELQARGIPQPVCEAVVGMIQTLDDVGYPLVDSWCELPEGRRMTAAMPSRRRWPACAPGCIT
jgi:chitin disaccharide deacetylase